MIPALRVFKSLIKCQTTYESNIFSTEGKVSPTINSQAQIIVTNKLLISSPDKHIFYYMGTLNQKHTINIEKKLCDCYFFKDKATCKHLAAACLQSNIYLNGLKSKPLRLRYLRRKLLKKVTSLNSRTQSVQGSQNFSGFQDQLHSANHNVQISTVEKTTEPLIDTRDCVAPNKTVKKGLTINKNIGNVFVQQPKRGRPTLAEKAYKLEKESQQLYCVCNKPSEGTMIGCDNNNCKIAWFHLKCVSLEKAPRGKWYCSGCK